MAHDLSQLAVFRRRAPGETRQAELRAGLPLQRADDGTVTLWSAPLVVEFKVPDAMKLAECEAAAQEAMAAIRHSPAVLDRYGFAARSLKDHELLALAKVISAVESAATLWTDWNFALEGVGDEAAQKRVLDHKAIAELMGDPDIRAAWMMHLDAASPLERAEGNVSGSSPSTNTAEEPDTATTAASPPSPAPEG